MGNVTIDEEGTQSWPQAGRLTFARLDSSYQSQAVDVFNYTLYYIQVVNDTFVVIVRVGSWSLNNTVLC